MSLSVRVQPRDGSWIELGTQQDGGHGVFPSSIEFDGDLSEYGCNTASFRVKQNPRFIRQYLEHFTPVVIADGNDHVWSGRIIATPTTFGDADVEVVVECQGWGQHLKDDCTDREWVIDDLSRWVDMRTMDGARLSYTEDAQNWNVTIGGNEIVLGAANGTSLVANSRCGVVLDLGPNGAATGFSIDWESSNNHSLGAMYVIGYNSNYWATAPQETNNGPKNNAGASGTYTDTFATPFRYVLVMMYEDSSTSVIGADVWFKLTRIRVFTDATNDSSGGASILKASTVISEALAACCPLISTDTSKILATSTSIPNFPGSPGWRYANELIDQANSIHGYVARLSPDPMPVFEFSPQPTDYSFVVAGGEYTLLEPAAQDGRGVYSRVISEYEDAAGVRAYATAINPSSGGTFVPALSQATNPSFTTDASSWTATTGSIARDTGTFDSTPASLAATTDGSGTAVFHTEAFTPVLTPGRLYRAQVRYNPAAAMVTGFIIPSYVGTNVQIDGTSATALTTGAGWKTATVDFIAQPDGVRLRFNVGGSVAAVNLRIDSIEIYDLASSVVDRRRFVRTAVRPIDARTNSTVATAIAQAELDASLYPPFKGTLGITGRIRTKGGGTQPVSVLPSRVGDRILIANLVDPNTGALGRSGIITRANYNADENRAEIEIDNGDDYIQTLRNRINTGV